MNIGDIADLFPAILKEKIKNGEFSFPDGTLFDYEDFYAYRCYFREDGDERKIGREDFRSHAELGIRLRGNGEKKPSYYGVSLFTSLDELYDIQSLNKPARRIAKGLVNEKGGPVLKDERKSHVNWWMYEIVDISSFTEVMEGKNERAGVF